MLGRAYTDIIEFWKSEQVPDGFGGTTTNEVKQFEKWANKQTTGAGRRFRDIGLNDFKRPVIFRIRKENTTIEELMFIKYRGHKFMIKDFEDVDLDGREINLFCDAS